MQNKGPTQIQTHLRLWGDRVKNHTTMLPGKDPSTRLRNLNNQMNPSEQAPNF